METVIGTTCKLWKYTGTVPKSISFSGYQADGQPWVGVAPTSATFTAFAGFDPKVLKYIWVGSAIDEARYLMWGPEQKEALVRLGLQYGVLTEYTSFLAIDQHVRYNVDNTTLFSVSQPLPLPAGVSNAATGNFWDGTNNVNPGYSGSGSGHHSYWSSAPNFNSVYSFVVVLLFLVLAQ